MNTDQTCAGIELNHAPVAIGRDRFLGLIVRTLSNTLEETVGATEASGFMNLVGLSVFEEIHAEYLRASGKDRLDRSSVTAVLLDLKHQLGGDFQIVEETDDRIVLSNQRCPFGALAANCSSLCMVTSHVFGHLMAESQGYGRVTLADTIARGAPACRIVIDLDPDAPGDEGQSYFARARS